MRIAAVEGGGAREKLDLAVRRRRGEAGGRRRLYGCALVPVDGGTLESRLFIDHPCCVHWNIQSRLCAHALGLPAHDPSSAHPPGSSGSYYSLGLVPPESTLTSAPRHFVTARLLCELFPTDNLALLRALVFCVREGASFFFRLIRVPCCCLLV